MKVPLLFIVFLFSQSVFPFSKPVSITPAPDSKFNKIGTSISLRFSQKISADFQSENTVSITGSRSGEHCFSIGKSDDGYTIFLNPLIKFDTDEKVSVIIKSSVKKNKNAEINFSFQTEKKSLQPDVFKIFNKEISIQDLSSKPDISSFTAKGNSAADFPGISITNSTAPSPGYIFLSNFAIINIPTTPYLLILDNTGSPIYFKQLTSRAVDFKRQPNGNYTYYEDAGAKFYEMNPQFEIIDSFACGNGYTTDLHELRLLSNRHSLLMSYDPQVINMRHFVPNGDSSAVVIGLVIQELDESKNVVFQWRSWDHFEITDATHEDFTAHEIDYVHGNAIEQDNDGNILISSRHTDEITKINRSSGEIIWRLGGKNNQFTFLDDSVKFSHQHAIRRIENGNITIFDNGNFRETLHRGPGNGNVNDSYVSRAVEYSLDEVNHTVRKVWEYRNDPPLYGYAMGNTQRLSNGNTIIGWGAGTPAVTEVNAKGTKVFEMTFTTYGICSYRVFRDNLTVTGTPSVSQNEIPKEYNLYQNFPNPFNPSTKIKFDIPLQSEVSIKIYNSIGQQVEEINKGMLSAGSYETVWNAKNFSSGIYFYQIQTAGFSQTKRMMLVK